MNSHFGARLVVLTGCVGVSVLGVLAVVGSNNDGIAQAIEFPMRLASLRDNPLESGSVSIRTSVPPIELAALPVTTPPEPATPAVRRTSVAAAKAESNTNFDMGDVERIRLRVWGHPDLGGEYSIDADATVSIPGVGRVPVKNLSPADLERELSDKVTGVTRRDVTVSIEVVRFRPYFIMGHIAEPGANEWRPGLNIVQAIASARGVLRSSDADMDARQLMQQQSRVQLRFALAQLSRLKAERDGTDSIEINSRIASLIQDSPATQQAQLKAFMNRQSAMLGEQRALLQSQLDGLERERDAALAELQAAENQNKSMNEQHEISVAMLRDIETLKDKQLIANSRYLQQRTETITSEVRLAESRAVVERSRARAESISRQIDRVQQERRAVLNERIEALEREVAQLELALAEVGTSSASRDGNFTLTYQIARNTADGMKTIAASVFSEVKPGDVVIVSGNNTDPAMRLSAVSNGSQTAAAAGPLEVMQHALEAASTTRVSASRRTSQPTLPPQAR